MTPDQLTEELQRVVKALLGYGARMPKELMLFVKNLVFLDGAIARLAPDLDLFAEIAHVATYFATTHGARLPPRSVWIRRSTLRPRRHEGCVRCRWQRREDDVSELQERRETIRKRLQERV